MALLSGHMYADVKALLAKSAGNYLEIGVFDGEGIAFLAKEFPDKQIYAVDPFIEDGHTSSSSGMPQHSLMLRQRENCLKNIRDLSNIVLHEQTSESYAAQATATDIAKMHVSVIAIDGDHHYESVVIDAALALRLLENRHGFIVFDDMDVTGVAHAYNEFVEQHQDRIANKFAGQGQVQILEISAL